jgi:hypothetical protein
MLSKNSIWWCSSRIRDDLAAAVVYPRAIVDPRFPFRLSVTSDELTSRFVEFWS